MSLALAVGVVRPSSPPSPQLGRPCPSRPRPSRGGDDLLLSNFAAQHTLQSHNLLLSTLCIVTFCSKEQFPSYWLVTVCFLTHFATQELNTLCSPTHFAKSQFTPQHTLVINTLCHSEPFTPHYTLLLNTLCHSEPFTPHYTLLLNTLCLPALFASWSTLLPNTFCSMNRNGNNPIYPLG